MPPRHLFAASLALTLAAVPLAPLAPRGAAGAQIAQSEYQERRAALTGAMADGVLLALGAREPRHDYLTFHQASPFFYLTGFDEPGAALVAVKRGGQTAATLFVAPRDPAAEVWTGARLGVDGVRRTTGLAARPADELLPVLDSLLAAGLPLYVVGELPAADGAPDDGEAASLTPDEQLVAALRQRHPRAQVRDVTAAVERRRGAKSPAELALIRKAVDITEDALLEAIRLIEPGTNEFEVEALIEYTFRRNGAAGPSFATIVGSGPNATTLHYNRNDRFMQAGELVVMDVGASYRGYAADVTRTVPVSGTFTPDQRAVYQIVRDAQAAAERQAKPGAAAQRMSDSAEAVLAAGLARLGLIESPSASYDCEPARQCEQLRLYYMHGLGHGIGLDVHDPEQFYFTGRIAPGSAFTIEPGIYVRANLLEILPDTPRNRALMAKIRPAVERYRNIGVRIEDDYVATEQGVEWISRVPREADEVEAVMRQPYAGPAKRDAAKVEWYRQTP